MIRHDFCGFTDTSSTGDKTSPLERKNMDVEERIRAALADAKTRGLTILSRFAQDGSALYFFVKAGGSSCSGAEQKVLVSDIFAAKAFEVQTGVGGVYEIKL